MPSRTYAWTRFWCSREARYDHLTSEGFLREPYWLRKQPNIGHIKPFAVIAATPVLILLGEPGIGKTFAITAERDAIGAAVAARGEQILWPDLQAISTPEGFERSVVNAPAFQGWLRGETNLHLYLDALDECMLRVQTLGRLLTNALQHGPAERLWLRLTCRTAEWKHELETHLQRLLGQDRVKAFELLPLTKRDVMTAVVANGIDEAKFFAYVQRTEAGALANRPASLEFLMRCFARGDVPTSQLELYERGCLTLCEETEHRTETGLSPAFTPSQRLAVAKRIAACTVFSTRSVLLFGRDDSEIPEDAVRMSELAGGKERAGPSAFEVTEAALKDVLDTGLFTSRGSKVLGWAHRTYQEYLAARYISESSLTPQQILPLIVHPDDADRKLTPQLHGVAAWLAALHPDIFDYILQHEPELILLSDVVVQGEEDRARLVAELLSRQRAQQIARIDVRMYPKLRKLAHSKLADQLRPVLTNTGEPDALRELVADLAEYAACAELIPELTQIALDKTQPLGVRIDAAGAIVNVGNDEQRTALRPLLDAPATNRKEHWLVRMALRGAWPHALSAEELFEFLSGPKRRLGTIGDDYLLVEDIRRTLNNERLGPALQWVLRRVQTLPKGPTFKLGDALQRLEDGIVIHAWRSDDDAVTAKLAVIAVEKIRRYEPLVSRDDLQDDDVSDQQLVNEPTRRRRFASFLLPALARRKEVVSPGVILDKTPYLQHEDLSWLVNRQAEVPHRPKESTLEAKLILWLADLTVPSNFDLVLLAAAHNTVLAERLDNICAAVPLASEEARNERQDYEDRQALAARRAKRRAEHQPPPEPPIQVTERLEETERRPCQLWRLFEEMALEVNDRHSRSWSLNVETFPGWIDSDEHLRTRTVAAAERFVLECDPDAESWFGTQHYALPAIGGVRALTLLQSANPQKFALLGSDVWKKWTPALLGIPNNDRNVPLLAVAYRHAPDEVIRRIQQLIRTNEAHVVRKLSDILDDRLAGAIVAIAREGGVPDETLTRMLEPLLQNPTAREYAASLVRGGSGTEAHETAVAVATMLLLHAPNESWEAIWPIVSTRRDFGRAVIERAVKHDHFDARPVYVLEENRVADLYLWLTREYPPKEDPYADDDLSTWRSRCLDSLKRRGTRAACDALRRLASQLREQTYLAPLVVEAESVRRQKSWQPTPIAVLRQLLADRSRRQVRSETELADVIIESLQRLERRLQGETPAAFDLWNTSPYTPKSENECSNYIARYLRDELKDRGVILAREVQIQPTASPGSGELTDLHVDVVAEIGGHVQTFSVIVEVKGCWNSGIPRAMTHQLARRYLSHDVTRTGVFLVCWFNSPTWLTSDRRKRKCPTDRAAIVAALTDEATALRAGGYDIRPMVLNCSLR